MESVKGPKPLNGPFSRGRSTCFMLSRRNRRKGSLRPNPILNLSTGDLLTWSGCINERLMDMPKRKRQLKITKSSGNVFADLGFPNPEQELLKARLTLQIYQVIKQRELTQAQAGEILGIKQPHVSGLMPRPLGKLFSRTLDGFPGSPRPRHWIRVKQTRKGQGRVSMGIGVENVARSLRSAAAAEACLLKPDDGRWRVRKRCGKGSQCKAQSMCPASKNSRGLRGLRANVDSHDRLV